MGQGGYVEKILGIYCHGIVCRTAQARNSRHCFRYHDTVKFSCHRLQLHVALQRLVFRQPDIHFTRSISHCRHIYDIFTLGQYNLIDTFTVGIRSERALFHPHGCKRHTLLLFGSYSAVYSAPVGKNRMRQHEQKQ